MSEPMVSVHPATDTPPPGVKGRQFVRFMVEFDGDAADLKRIEETCREAVVRALAVATDRVDIERRRQAWADSIPAGLLVAGVVGLVVAPFGWVALAAGMSAGFVAVAGFSRLATS